MTRFAIWSGLACGFALASVGATSVDAPGIDAAFQKFWTARNPQEAAKAADAVVASGVDVAGALERLQRGRTYSASVPRGELRLQRRAIQGDFFYDVKVPETYDPARTYALRFQLHGGVMMRETGAPMAGRSGRGGGRGAALEGERDQIYVMPTAWRDAPWWSRAQIENLDAILDSLKRTYNVDENHVAVAGVSDGATGLYYVAMRDTTPFASFLPLNGSMMVLANDRLAIDTNLFPTNLRNKPFFIVNGGQDPLYPTRNVEPYIAHLDRGGVFVEYHARPEAGHNTAWWPQMKDPFEAFVKAHPRNPLPETLTWEATDRDVPSRAHWLIIDTLAATAKSEPPMQPDLNVFTGEGFNKGRELYARTRPSGRVDLTRDGNTVRAATRGVAQFTLLLSPAMFDLSQPVRVVLNGRALPVSKVEPSVATLMRWAARDNDRSMLFAAELHVSVPASR
jgi:hypothetical protein